MSTKSRFNIGSQIDFYVLQKQSPGGRFKLACRIVEKAYRLSHRVYLRTGNSDDSKLLDDLLWTFSQNSFIPHELSTANNSRESPVVIGTCLSSEDNTDVVISVADEPVSDFTAYPRIAEIVGYSDEEKASGRNRFRYYREQGVEPNTHQIIL
jgi:DNA polymerase-3 subunit chi